MPSFSDLQALLSRDPETLRRLGGAAGSFFVDLLIAIVIMTATVWAAGFLSRAVQRTIPRMSRHHPIDSTLPLFIGSVVRYGVFIIGLVAAVQQLGVQTTSIIAVLGAASLAIGLALQGALANVAAGVMLLILRPYRVGDDVEITGRQGKVRALTLFTTELTSNDGLQMVLPNGKILGELIINFSARGKRRYEIVFGIDYEDNLDEALDLAVRCARDDKRVLGDPEPWAKVTGLTDNAVSITLRAWVRTSDYAEAHPDMIKCIKQRFEAAGFSFPYPHQVGVPFEAAHPEAAAKVAESLTVGAEPVSNGNGRHRT
jgi:small conductance mechanosensitive channel